MSAARTVRWDVELPVNMRGDELVIRIDEDSYRYVGIALDDDAAGEYRIALTLVEARDLHAALADAQFPTKS